MPFLIPIIAILSVYGFKAYKMHLQYRGAALSNTDRQTIENLSATAQRLEQRVTMLERALLDAEQSYPHGTEV
ncbi:hypothetical protein [Acidiphilium sp.]|uniref:hypothetical protein n=1 Tax=Acidiphilium sp. TaxID=527 RepID=UPI003CFFCC6E